MRGITLASEDGRDKPSRNKEKAYNLFAHVSIRTAPYFGSQLGSTTMACSPCEEECARGSEGVSTLVLHSF